jgi:hypothetical protein
MRRAGKGLIALVALVALFAGLGSGTAAAGNMKLVEGTVYDTTCVTVCTPPCPPPCGPIPAPQSPADVICAQAQMVCPLADSSGKRAAPDFCILGEPCGVSYPVYSGEGSLVNVRKRGSATVLARLSIVEGHFKIRLAPGEYVFHPYMAEEQCWSAEPVTTKVSAKLQGPVPATLNATNRCVVHADAK